ncbi:DUF4391 domain-containing protein [Thiomicrospira microaerophila]|uniref:DUF4391 domain-containing protein n=1 Tax=Thiomicrospira microaerophila TaxID=406020 RepID=UPI00200FEB46|nr:DUF4391 domain-containing protein [Thiomicrospira microaerophila]UQB41800.1 DUF4391 domain-containing protein [Thiomicrospira microaerophila]
MLIEALQLPPALRINQKLTKKSFYDNGQLSASAQKLLQEQVESISLQAHLQPDNSNIAAYKTAQHEYLEIFVIQLTMKDNQAWLNLKSAQLKSLHETVHKAIAYPLFLEIKSGEQVQWSLAEKFVHQADSEHDKLILNELLQTEWLDTTRITRPAELQKALIHRLAFTNQNQQNLYTLYQSWYKALTGYALAHQAGLTDLPSTESSLETQRAKLKQIQQLKKDINDLKNQLKTCHQFNEKVELNIRLQNLTKQLNDLISGE